MIKVDLNRYPKNQEDADYRLKRQVKKAIPSSVGLRDTLQSIDEKYPWSYLKHKIMMLLSLCTFFMGTMFYALDIYTDIKFSHEMLTSSVV